MSLLLEALKKAELAKQNASGPQAEGAAAPSNPADGPLSLEPTTVDPHARPLITRDRLPDITQPLEILSEDLPSAGIRREAPLASAASTPSAGMSSASATEEEERASARHLFEAKAPDYDPRRPFFVILGVLGVGILGVLGYFAFELFGPRPSYYAAPAGGKSVVAAAVTPPAQRVAPQPSAAPEPPAPPPAAAAVAPVATVTAEGPSAVPATPQPAIPGGTRSTIKPAAARPGITQTRAEPSGTHSAAAEPAEPRASPTRAPVSITPGGPRVDPTLESAWLALQAGDLARAGESYQRVLRANPRNRDALLGLAAVEARTQDYEGAESHYLRVLELDPRDAYAQAGLLALRGLSDPVQSESRLKNLLAHQPDATFLNYSLGNQYAAQGRWPDAQGAYFKAFSSDPENADYAYNLAVSLDHLRQEKLALEYYRRALALAGNRAVGFNGVQVEARIRELTR